MAFPCPIGQIVQVLEPVLHAKLPGYPRYGFGIDPGQTWRESAMDSVKQKEQRESEAIRAALCQYEYEICRVNTQCSLPLSSSVRMDLGFECRKTPKFRDTRGEAEETGPGPVAQVCRETKLFCDDICNTMA